MILSGWCMLDNELEECMDVQVIHPSQKDSHLADT